MMTKDLRYGKLKGTDAFGNRYFERYDSDTLKNRERWVMYAQNRRNRWDASQVPPEWHGWLHHTLDNPVTVTDATGGAFKLRHMENVTSRFGAEANYLPPGHHLTDLTKTTSHLSAQPPLSAAGAASSAASALSHASPNTAAVPTSASARYRTWQQESQEQLEQDEEAQRKLDQK